MEEGRELRESKVWVKVRRTTEGQQWDGSHPECSRNKEAGWGSQASLRKTVDSALRAMCHLAPGPWLLTLHFLHAHWGVQLNQCFPKNCAVDTELGGV